MKPIVYIDTLFLVNLIFNMFIFYMSAYLLKKNTSALRIFLVSCLGALYGVLMFFPKLSIFYTGIFKILFMVLSAKILFSSKSFKELVFQSLMCFFVSIGFCGAIYACIALLPAGTSLGLIISRGVVYIDIDPLILILGIAVSLVVIIFFSAGCRENFKKDNLIKELYITAGGKTFMVKALSDTGCDLYDPSGKLPVLIIEKGLIPEEIKAEDKITLKFSSITREDESMEAFYPDSVTDRDKKIFYKAVIAEGKSCLDENRRFNAVANPEIFNLKISEDREYEKIV